MQNDAQTRALEVCLQNMQAGEKLDQVLDLYPQWIGDLTQPLEAAQALRVYAGSLQIEERAQEQSRSGFLENAQQIAQESSLAAPVRARFVRLGRLILFVGIVAAFLWLFMAATRALPGDLTYPLKQAAWQIRLQASRDPNRKLVLTRQVDQLHLQEIRDIAALGREADVRFAGLLKEDSSGAWKASGFPLALADEAQVIGKVVDGIWVEVDGALQQDGSVRVARIRPHEIVLQGALQDLTSDTLKIDGIPVQFGEDTLVHGSPLIGSRVQVIVFRTADDRLLARLVDADIVP